MRKEKNPQWKKVGCVLLFHDVSSSSASSGRSLFIKYWKVATSTFFLYFSCIYLSLEWMKMYSRLPFAYTHTFTFYIQIHTHILCSMCVCALWPVNQARIIMDYWTKSQQLYTLKPEVDLFIPHLCLTQWYLFLPSHSSISPRTYSGGRIR